jgi:hypothetical protein
MTTTTALGKMQHLWDNLPTGFKYRGVGATLYAHRVGILKGMGATPKQASEWAKKAWRHLPRDVRFGLATEYAKTGEPERE